MKKDERIDAYISNSKAFAVPILEHIRLVVHKACPQAEETIKWGFPHFDYKGKLMCSMASFKEHCALIFHKAALINDTANVFTKNNKSGMGNFGKLKSLKDLPSQKILTGYIKQAMKLNDAGVKLTVNKLSVETEIPGYLSKALSKNKKAKSVFDNFPPSHRKEYIKWLEEAKTEATRNKRLATAIEWISEGKGHNWRYEKPKSNEKGKG